MSTEKISYPKIAAAVERAGAAFPTAMAQDFARVLANIELHWGGQEAIQYFNSLLLDDREGRKGFPQDILREIALLKQVHDFLFPSLEITPYDPFSSIGMLPPHMESAPHIPAANLLEYAFPEASAPAANAASASATRADAADPAMARTHGSWPRIHTQYELMQAVELQHAGKSFYVMKGKTIGEILMHHGFTDERTMRIVHGIQERNGHHDMPIGKLLVNIGILSEEDLVCALCVQSGTLMVDMLGIPIPFETTKLIPIEKAREKQVVPVGVHRDTLLLAVADPLTFNDASFYTMLTGLKVEPVYAPRNEIVNRLNMHGLAKNPYEAREEFHSMAQKAYNAMPDKPVVAPAPPETDISENDATIINLVNKMILNAIGEGASDIHIELFQGNEESDIRFRRDGRMEKFSDFPRNYHGAVVSRIKIMSGLDISERRRPQDGKISFSLPNGGSIDLRVSTIPTMRGAEFVTIRILTAGDPLPLSDLGMAKREMEAFREAAHHSYGLILVCGPTGSGKTTTLHSVIRELNTSDRKIWTVEDPVEIVQPRLCQVQVNNKIGVTFASTLRVLLRADPDIIMIGEMRDQETARIALEASMTGHLVLSTLHTNSASETVARLLDLGIDPYNLSDALLSILAQRLARKLCVSCAKQEEIPAHELDELANEYHQSANGKPPGRAERENLIRNWREAYGVDGQLYCKRAVGCRECSEGYSGRIGLYELLQATPAVRHLVRQQSSAAEYQTTGIAEGMRTLKQDGIEKVLRGITDIAQVRSACT
ncbi:MAG: type II/IV secretion system protein [Nitrosomonadales bacterium]|nr:type II/IV secretion system protein [Nitrosomonadales bacterium]